MKIKYKGHIIEKPNGKSHVVAIYKNNNLVKCIAGDIRLDGTENSVEKAKTWIDNIN